MRHRSIAVRLLTMAIVILPAAAAAQSASAQLGVNVYVVSSCSVTVPMMAPFARLRCGRDAERAPAQTHLIRSLVTPDWVLQIDF